MEHIVQFGINIDDEAIKRTISSNPHLRRTHRKPNK